ncbi:hypothetical protein QTO34_013920 [Cnephaeus nilssonii]|uniref:Centromere protein H C-terminal domain-containing protein n=1 Tax=Cnephaeus nilssonii TaxID=3371016 RepID=A0AA40LTG8_CNENI|nr:hypothetical protein QTO34_013920 [Eptesicus nilssonii]
MPDAPGVPNGIAPPPARHSEELTSKALELSVLVVCIDFKPVVEPGSRDSGNRGRRRTRRKRRALGRKGRAGPRRRSIPFRASVWWREKGPLPSVSAGPTRKVLARARMEPQPEEPGAAERAGPAEDPVALLLRLRAQTKQQLLEYKSMVDANEEKTPEEIIPEKQIETKIEDLENEIEKVKIAFEMKKLALDRMQLSTALRKNLEESNIQTRYLFFFPESWDLEEKLLDVKKKRFELKRASESKFLEIQTEKNKQNDDLASMENSDKIKTLQQKLQKEIQITTVIQHVFQNLILGSKVNWAEDSAFKETVLQLEKNLTMI